MQRKIITIDEDACTGCGLCVSACHEGAIAMVDGKAHLIRDDYCDALGDCLPECPAGAISFTVREAAAYDAQAVAQAKAAKAAKAGKVDGDDKAAEKTQQPVAAMSESAATTPTPSALAQWPCQIKLVPVRAPYFDQADLLIAADCTAYAFADLHRTLMAGRVTLIGCPKLDSVDYADKLGAIFSANNIRSVVVARMEVPCCGGLVGAVQRALTASGKTIPAQVVTFGTDGTVLGHEKIEYQPMTVFEFSF